jgi:hypothetical protein
MLVPGGKARVSSVLYDRSARSRYDRGVTQRVSSRSRRARLEACRKRNVESAPMRAAPEG